MSHRGISVGIAIETTLIVAVLSILHCYWKIMTRTQPVKGAKHPKGTKALDRLC